MAPQTSGLPQTVIDKFYEKHSIKVTEGGGVRPVLEFADANLDERCMKVCAEFERPTPIQSVCWPLVAGGRDAIGIAETGSGKTLAFSVPGLQHLAHRKRTEAKVGGSEVIISLFRAKRRSSLFETVTWHGMDDKPPFESICIGK